MQTLKYALIRELTSNLIKERAELAAKNANPNNWRWTDGSKDEWKPAEETWQDFRDKWYGNDEPVESPLSLEPLQSRMVVRESYATIFDQVWAHAMYWEGEYGAIITGQPGIGKTLFQYYLLIRLLRCKQVVLFSVRGEQLLFYHDSVYQVKTATKNPGLPRPNPWSSMIFIWSLLDIEAENEPTGFLVRKPCLSVQTASPNRVQNQQWAKEREPMFTDLPLWTSDELAEGLLYHPKYTFLLRALNEVYAASSGNERDPLLRFPGVRAILEQRRAIGSMSPEESPEGASEAALDCLLGAAIDRFGHSARDVFHAVFSYGTATEEHMRASNISCEELKASVSALARGEGISDTSYRILALRPDYHDDLSVSWSFLFKSNWIKSNLILKLDAGRGAAIRELIDFFQTIPEGKSLAVSLLELFAHQSIAEPDTDGFWPLLKTVTRGGAAPLFTVAENSSALVPEGVQFAKVKRKIAMFEDNANLPVGNGIYYIPESSTFPSFDAYTIDYGPSGNSATLWILQLARSEKCRDSVKGCPEIRMIIGRLKSKLREKPPPLKTMKLTTAQTSSQPTVRVHYLLAILQGDARQWRFPRGWVLHVDGDDDCGGVYGLELPLAVSDAIAKIGQDN